MIRTTTVGFCAVLAERLRDATRANVARAAPAMRVRRVALTVPAQRTTVVA